MTDYLDSPPLSPAHSVDGRSYEYGTGDSDSPERSSTSGGESDTEATSNVETRQTRKHLTSDEWDTLRSLVDQALSSHDCEDIAATVREANKLLSPTVLRLMTETDLALYNHHMSQDYRDLLNDKLDLEEKNEAQKAELQQIAHSIWYVGKQERDRCSGPSWLSPDVSSGGRARAGRQRRDSTWSSGAWMDRSSSRARSTAAYRRYQEGSLDQDRLAPPRRGSWVRKSPAAETRQARQASPAQSFASSVRSCSAPPQDRVDWYQPRSTRGRDLRDSYGPTPPRSLLCERSASRTRSHDRSHCRSPSTTSSDMGRSVELFAVKLLPRREGQEEEGEVQE